MMKPVNNISHSREPLSKIQVTKPSINVSKIFFPFMQPILGKIILLICLMNMVLTKTPRLFHIIVIIFK